jgi:hypothetical protein
MWASPPPPPPVPKSTSYTRWLVMAIALISAALIGLVAANTGGSGRAAPKHQTHIASVRPVGPTTSTSTTAPTTTSTSTTTTTIPSPAVPGGPVVTSMAPSSGGPGQMVTIQGANLMSSSGVITLAFAGTTAPVSCPTPNECVGAVPSGINAPPSTQLPVTITTSAGSSRPLPFLYTG